MRLSIWQQMVEHKADYIGGTLVDLGSGDPIADIVCPLPEGGARTRIVDLQLRPNGDKDQYFEVIGEAFSCGGSIQWLAVDGDACREHDATALRGYGGHLWYFTQPARVSAVERTR